MSQKGQAGRALGAALTSCGAGSVLTSFLALIMVPAVLLVIMAIHASEMVFIILIGLSFIAILGRGSAIKALAHYIGTAFPIRRAKVNPSRRFYK